MVLDNALLNPPRARTVEDVLSLAATSKFTPAHSRRLADAITSQNPWVSVAASVCLARRASGKPINRAEFALLLEFEEHEL